ncbi:hypothetical protein [Streptomyces qinzhouensis]|uniref:PH domain-containing protein n=1 Tax=Streptomyces qinzhouensis TaxID=2599401 RepID=A0A5B8JFS3_9ACTN|nr:hypothetical protein [Streptomyces qinzhouensis]QDY80326.1 hypothetical protein FQU76_31715 [Streptomyces qinzhouensis]
MEPIEYRNREARRALVLVVVSAVWGSVALVRLLRGADPGFFDALSIASLVLAPFLLNAGLGRITVDATGIHAWRPFARRTYHWQDISGITVEERTGRGYGAHRIKILRHGRRARFLPAPYVDSRASRRWYEELLTQAEDLRARHRAALADGSGRPGGGPASMG